MRVRNFLLFGILVFMIGNVLAVEGVVPRSYEVDFEPGLEEDFVFDFVLNDVEMLSVEGDLANYVELDKKKIVERGSVVAKLKFPEGLTRYDYLGLHPGVNSIEVVAGKVVGVIKVIVPYPDEYLELKVFAPNVNVGEDVVINLKVSNFGKEIVNVVPVVEIYFNGDVVGVFEGNVSWVDVSAEEDYEFLLKSFNYSAGDYLVKVRVGDFVAEDVFRLGEFRVKILNYTREVRGGGIREFEIEVESFSDSNMEEVYAEVRPIGMGDGFDTTIVSLGKWEKKTLVGYFDTTGFKDEVSLEIDVYYDDKVESRIVRVFVGNRFDWRVFVVGFFVLVLLGFFGWRLFSGKSK